MPTAAFVTWMALVEAQVGKVWNWMTYWELCLTGAALSMDAFAVSVSSGMVLQKTKWRHSLKIAASFGLFQGLMPVIGYTVARTFADKIQAIDHWVAFLLLAFIGGKMLWEVRDQECEIPKGNPLQWQTLLVMSIATSIDALAVGAAFAVRPAEGLLAPRYGFLLCAAVIAVITFVICAIGVRLGRKSACLLGRKAEMVGGLVLILLGLKILVEHIWFQ